MSGTSNDKQQSRGKGGCRKVRPEARLPTEKKDSWSKFLHNNENKALFEYLNSVAIPTMSADKWVNVQSGENVIPLGNAEIMPPCWFKEPDAPITVHLCDAVTHGFSNILVRTVDSDVIAIIIGHIDRLIAIIPNVNVAVAYGVGSKYKLLDVTAMPLSLPEKVMCLCVSCIDWL